MQRALVCLNFCGSEAVWHKLKNTLKTPKMHFLPVFELMSDSLTATKVETNQCPSHQSILLTQGPIHENFMKKYWELAELENEVFLRRPFWIFKSAILNFFFASFLWKIQPFYMRYHFFLHYGWFFQNLGKEAVRTFMHTTVQIFQPKPRSIQNHFFRISVVCSYFLVKTVVRKYNCADVRSSQL